MLWEDDALVTSMKNKARNFALARNDYLQKNYCDRYTTGQTTQKASLLLKCVYNI
jgi:hypothetical protein